MQTNILFRALGGGSLFQHVGRRIVTRIIHMDKRPVYDWDGFEEVGQNLAEIMAVLEGSRRTKNNVDLDKELVTGMVGAEVLNLTDSCCKTHSQVEKQVSLVGLGGKAGQVADVMGRRLAPVEDDNEG